jgi:cell division protein FtsB
MDGQFYRKEKKQRRILKRILGNRRLLIGLIVGIPLLLFVLFGSRGIVQRIRLEHEKADLEEQIRAAEQETTRLQTASKALDGDKKAIEKVAREKFGMVRRGEKVYKVDQGR